MMPDNVSEWVGCVIAAAMILFVIVFTAVMIWKDWDDLD
jgi:hypothetical protein